MAIPNIALIGYSGMASAKAGMSTTGHNIANATTEGFSRQRVITEAATPSSSSYGKNFFGTGSTITRVERVNDEFLEKQIRNAQRDLSHFEEKDLALTQVEEVFNEMGGEGLNRSISKFFNEFRRLEQEPNNTALRNSIREVSQSMINDFHRIRKEVTEIRDHIDSRIEASVDEVNTLVEQVRDLNEKIRMAEVTGTSANDFQDKRDLSLKKLGSYLEITAYKNKNQSLNVDIKGVGPLVTGPLCEKLQTVRSGADQEGKAEGTLDLITSGSAHGGITHHIKEGKLGALLETRDQVITGVLSQLDQLAFGITEAVNEIHIQGYTGRGDNSVLFFGPVEENRAAELICLSDDILESADNIAAAAEPDAPGDSRIAVAIAKLQGQKIVDSGSKTADECFNTLVSNVGMNASHNKFTMNREKDIVTQLGRMREQISGVSIDEETSHLLEFQHAFDASAKVIQVADEMLKTILALKRD